MRRRNAVAVLLGSLVWHWSLPASLSSILEFKTTRGETKKKYPLQYRAVIDGRGGYDLVFDTTTYDSLMLSTLPIQSNMNYSHGLLDKSRPAKLTTVSWSTVADQLPRVQLERISVVEVNSNVASSDFNGTIGLGLSSSIFPPESSFLAQLKSQNYISHQIFSLSTFWNDTASAWVRFGLPDESLGEESIQYVNLASDTAWQLGLYTEDESGFENGFVFGTKSFCDKSSNNPCIVELDTSSSTIGVPASSFKAVMDAVTEGYSCDTTSGEALRCDCQNDMNRFPNISIDMSRTHDVLSIILYPEDYVDHVGEWCFPKLRSSMRENVFVLGEPLTTPYYTIFDAEQRRIGFSRIRRSTNPWNEEGTSEKSTLARWFLLAGATFIVLLFVLRYICIRHRLSHPSSQRKFVPFKNFQSSGIIHLPTTTSTVES